MEASAIMPMTVSKHIIVKDLLFSLIEEYNSPLSFNSVLSSESLCDSKKSGVGSIRIAIPLDSPFIHNFKRSLPVARLFHEPSLSRFGTEW